MTPKASFQWVYLFITLALAACSSSIQASPTTDQKAIGTGVAATLNAAFTATQRALLTDHPFISSSSTPLPALTVSVLPSATPKPTLTPTTFPTPGLELVAYTKNNDIYLWSPESGTTQLTEVHDVVSVRLSGDGALVAYKRQEPENIALQELWVVNTVGSPDPRQLVSANDLAALVPSNAGSGVLGYGILDFSWRPGTHQLAYNTLVLHEGPGFGPNHDLRLVDADTLQKTTLFDTGQGGLFYYSPDGNQIALSNPESISLVNSDGRNLRREVLSFENVITYSEYEYHPHPIWRVDSNALGVAIPPHDPLSDPRPLTGIWRIPVDGSSSVLLGSVPAIPFAWPDTAIAPDLAVIAYSADATGDGQNQRDLHLSNPDGSGDRIYASGDSLEFVSWSTDSLSFLYKIQGGSEEGLYIGYLNGSPVMLSGDPHSIRDIQWLDGTRLIYFINQNNQWALHLANLDAEDLALIDTIPDASPDLDHVP
jgi:hypothetical protein